MPNKHQYATIPLTVLIYIAWRNLVSKKLRAFLTVFGIVIGVGAIFFLLSFGLGLQHLVTNQVIGNQSIKSVDVTTSNSKIIKLDEASLQKIKNLPHVSSIGTSYSFAGSLKFRGSEIDAITYGVNNRYETLSNFSVTQGRLLSDTDGDAVVLNQTALRDIGISDAQSVIGQKVTIIIPLESASATTGEINRDFTVVGVLGSGSGSEAYVPNGVFQPAGVTAYTQFKLEVDNTANVSGLRSQIESLGFLTASPIDTIDQINQIFKFFNFILVGFGAIGMIVAVLGMFNTLTISLLERTKEIGLMVALGGRNRDMRKLFIFEAILLSLVGAVIGIILAISFGQILNLVMNQLAHSRGVSQRFNLFATPLWLIAATIFFMVMVGLIVVFFPARRAERINPIDALRRE